MENPSVTAHHSASMNGHTLGKSPMNVRIAGNHSGRAPTSLSTGGSIQERSHMSAGTVGKPSHTARPLPSTRELILGKPTSHSLEHGKALSHSSSCTRLDPVILNGNNTSICICKPSTSTCLRHPQRDVVEMIVEILSSRSSIPRYQIIQTVIGKCGINQC